MNNDLISREALKTNIDKFIGYLDEDMIYRIKVVIDNAPTVEPQTKLVANVTFNKEQMEELVEKAKADILKQIERPQGEWIEKGKYQFECNQCHYDDIAIKSNFCPNCGADMRGGAK